MDILTSIASNNGLLGALFVLAVIGLIAVSKLLLNEKDGRLKDQKENTQNLLPTLKALQQTADLILSSIKK